MQLDFAPLPEDATAFDPVDFGTIYQSLERAVARYPHNDAYVVPAMPKRPYHPDGVTFTWKQTWDEVQKRIAWYRERGYGPGHRVAILFDQRPEFVFHHYALNALGCTVAPISPDYRLDEIAYLLEHSEAVVALAIESHPVGRERLVDRVWPDLHDESAYNALKMCVHRTRQQLADPNAIIVTRGGYTLAPDIEVDLRALEAALERIRRSPDANEPGLEGAFDRLVRGRPSFFANWEWFGPIERILESATHEVGAFVAEHAVRRGDHVRALAIAQMLVKLDPLDEAARRVAIRAHLAANDRGAAILEYRSYKAMLHEELDVEPSADLKHLLEAS